MSRKPSLKRTVLASELQKRTLKLEQLTKSDEETSVSRMYSYCLSSTTFLINIIRLVYKDGQYTFQQLLDKDNIVTIHHRNLQKLATEMYKLQNNLSPKFMKGIFQEQVPSCFLRTEKMWESRNNRIVYWGDLFQLISQILLTLANLNKR